jgi:uncharacterized protein (TIGR03382 family)
VPDNDTLFSDDDGDGLTEEAGDCDDTDPSVYPGAVEQQNGKDDDCDGAVDEGLEDKDGDLWSDEQGDCDDDNGWIHPEALEVCDGLDNDCDGVIDNGCQLEDALEGLSDALGSCDGCATGSSPAPLGGLGMMLASWIGIRRRRSRAP